MKKNTIAVAIALTIGGTALFANTETHQWNLAVEQVPALCSFSDNIPVELVSNPTTGRFELESPGSLTILAQGMGAISYTTNRRVYDTDGVYQFSPANWDLSQITLTDSIGNLTRLDYCSNAEDCDGVLFELRADQLSDTYLLNVEGSVSLPEDYTLIDGAQFYVDFMVQCAEK